MHYGRPADSEGHTKGKRTMNQFPTNAKVAGEYFGVPFTGTIEHARPHTLGDAIVVHILLDASITVYDEPRYAIAMEVSGEGRMVGAPGFVKVAS